MSSGVRPRDHPSSPPASSSATGAAIKKQERTADRVFLGPDDEGVKKFVLTGNAHLSGRGTVRVHGGWKDFAFVCDLDPAQATVKSFTYKLDAK